MKKPRLRRSVAAVLADSRWKALACGRATPEEIAELRAWAQENEAAAEAWAACRPATKDETENLADELWRQRFGATPVAKVEANRLEAALDIKVPQADDDKTLFARHVDNRNTGDHRSGKTKSATRLDPATIERVVAGDPPAIRQFIITMAPVVARRLGRLMRESSVSRHNIQDITQDTFFALLQHEGRLLKSWDPKKGSIESFVEFIATWKASNVLRRRRELLVDSDQIESVPNSSLSPEQLTTSRQFVQIIAAVLRGELSEQGRRLFELLFIEGRSVNEVAPMLAMGTNAVYAWKSRLASRLREISRSMADSDLHQDGTSDEEQQIAVALAQAGGNQQLAAEMLRISNRTLSNRLNSYPDIPRPKKKPGPTEGSK